MAITTLPEGVARPSAGDAVQLLVGELVTLFPRRFEYLLGGLARLRLFGKLGAEVLEIYSYSPLSASGFETPILYLVYLYIA